MPGSIVKKALGRGEDERGVIAVLFAILILPLMTVMAIAIDLSQFLVMKQQLSRPFQTPQQRAKFKRSSPPTIPPCR